MTTTTKTRTELNVAIVTRFDSVEGVQTQNALWMAADNYMRAARDHEREARGIIDNMARFEKDLARDPLAVPSVNPMQLMELAVRREAMRVTREALVTALYVHGDKALREDIMELVTAYLTAR